ncbi:AsmA-like C-terminal region-containing protein [Enterovirga rhinocerotis]|uniref:AsmA-like protein n=1 Tax=Enterovirga rhinocerotis TaxID=1339210 RepID=A0A4R7BNL4_9HYPH|nr:AsmA-like C-terminal region-containing protein [Enterovirga rhinocerotis]TDR85527.1 AsmA-like protein [Enterovirga rhinocerotis]
MRIKAKLPRRDARSGPKRRRAGLRAVQGCAYVLAGLLVIVAVAAGGFYLRLAASPLNLADYKGRLEEALTSRLGAGWRVTVDETVLELYGGKPALRAGGLEIRNPVGITVVRTPWALVSLNPLSLLVGHVSPREIELRDVHLRGVIAKDGTLSFSSALDGPAIAAPPLPEGTPSTGSASPEAAAPDVAVPPTPASGEAQAPSVVSTAVASLIRPLVESSGLIGALDRARLVDANLSLLGYDGRERVAFRRVNAVFEQVEGGDRRFDLELQGVRGDWHVHGTVGGRRGHPTSIEAEGVPLADIMLLAGLSKVPVASDVKISASLATAFGRGRLDHLSGRLHSSAGTIARKGSAPIRLDGASAQVQWDETSRVLAIPALTVQSEGTRVVLDGSVALAELGRWRIGLSGRDVVVAALDPQHPAFRLGSVQAEALVGEDSIRLDKLALKGEGVDMALTGSFTPNSTTEILSGRLDVKGTDALRLVRLWPDTITPDLRAYLAKRLLSGSVEQLTLSAALDAQDMKAAFSDAPMTERSVSLSFAASGIGLSVVDGLPPLRDLTVAGTTSGTHVSLKAEDGAIAMPDGRRLSFSDASYLHTTLHQPGSAATIGFRIQGGLDALASFVRSPLIAEAGLPEIDPAAVRGRLDLKASLPLIPGTIPPLSDLAIDVTGNLSDVVVDKLPGKERLEAGAFTVSREAGLLTIKGDGRLSGVPTAFDLRLPRTGTGELLVSATLDEAARGRRGLPVAPVLTGPVAVKVAVPLGAKGVPRVEADLARAGIDGLLPGWQKAPGRPGRVSFTKTETGGVTELRDLQVESGSVQIRGLLGLGQTGAVERADITSLRLSPGDDMKAQLERSGGVYRLVVRGNNIDARPFLKWINAAPAKGAAARESQDIELDLSSTILSGFNDEAMTNVSAKGSVRDGDLRALQFAGRFRSAAVEAQLAKRDAGAPILALRSGDAGATLRFLDLYRRMTSGRLTVDARTGDGVQEGRITIDEFALQGEPALRRIVSQTQQSATSANDERGGTASRSQAVDQIAFNRLTTAFRRQGARMDYSDAVIYGPQVGFNLSGFVDHARDRLDITGTFVPAYMLNNAFSQIPVVGLILGGGRNEGLIAVEFRVAGALTNPSVTVNPLSAVAPGILRKLFGWMQTEGQPDASAPSPAANAVQPPRRRSAR